MSYLLDTGVRLETTSCCRCGVVFAMPETMLDKRRTDGGDFYCPNGHTLHFTKPEVQRLRDALDRSQARARHLEDQRQAAERSNTALRGVITKQKKRAMAGMCPCCKRTFRVLADHMATKHPDYAEDGQR